MGAIRILAGIACLAAVAVAGGAGAQEVELPLQEGWHEGVEVTYYDLGSNSGRAGHDAVATAPVWRLIHGFDAEGEPRFIDGQGSIFETRPGDPDYTDLWQVNFVIAPEDYEPGSITSLAEIEAAGYAIRRMEMRRNCPIVPDGTTLDRGGEVLHGWVSGDPIEYFDFGLSTSEITPVWVLVHGISEDGTPDPVEGQHDVFDSVPGEAGYTAFHRIDYVIVPDDYEANTIRSAADVRESGYDIRAGNRVVNYPIARAVDEAAPPASQPDGYRGSSGGGSKVLLALVAGVLLAGGLATAGTFKLARRAR